jgi:hypothetical protein
MKSKPLSALGLSGERWLVVEPGRSTKDPSGNISAESCGQLLQAMRAAPRGRDDHTNRRIAAEYRLNRRQPTKELIGAALLCVRDSVEVQENDRLTALRRESAYSSRGFHSLD